MSYVLHTLKYEPLIENRSEIDRFLVYYLKKWPN